MAQLMPLPLTVSCFSKIEIGSTFLVPAHPGSPGKRAVKWVCVCVCVCILVFTARRCASAIFAVVGCLSICLSATSWYCIETTGQIELVLAWRLLSTYPTLCYKEIRVIRYLQNSGYFPLELCRKLCGLCC